MDSKRHRPLPGPAAGDLVTPVFAKRGNLIRILNFLQLLVETDKRIYR
jgi:hypothetical protein